MRFDLMQPLGSICSQPETNVAGVVRGAEERIGLGEQLRSLAHPGWPYAGTEHAWRGFVEIRYQKLDFGRLD